MSEPGSSSAAAALTDLQRQVRALLDQAVTLHRAGTLDEAEALYRRVLDLDPQEPNALTNIGTICFQRGQLEAGIPFLEASLKAKPAQPNALSNLANGLTMLGRFAEARTACEQAVALQPDNADAHNNLGNALRELGDIDGAAASYERAFALDPTMASALGNEATLLRADKRLEAAEAVLRRALAAAPAYADAWNELGNCLQDLKRPEEALEAYDRALAINPDHVQALGNAAIAFSTLKRHEEALAFCDRALALKPDDANALNNRGSALRGLKRHDEAIADFRRTLALMPDRADTHNNLGVALNESDRFEEALEAFSRTIALDPALGEAYGNRGNALRELRRFEEALADYDIGIGLKANLRDTLNNRGICLAEMRRFDAALAAFDDATAVDPAFADPAWNRALIQILTGDYAEGWRNYEQRWKREDFKDKPNPYRKKPWLGEGDIAGKILLLTAEPGLGDTLQMLRYAPLLARRGAKVLAAVQTPLVELTRGVEGIWRALGEGQVIAHWDAFIPTMSLPLAFGSTLATIPQNIPYVFADAAVRAAWAARLGPRIRPRIGLVWSGSREHKNDHNRSIPLKTLLPLLDLDAEFVSLQVDYREADLALLQQDGRILNLKDEIKSFADTAAIMDQLDLVISVDTSVAHLAGAMGRPLWLLLPYTPDYRWGLDVEDSPWYPTARLWRQGQERQWAPVIERVSAAAASWLQTV